MKKSIPFANGSEFESWTFNNCDGCKISTTYRDSNRFICHIEKALIEASFDDGLVDDNILNKIGKKGLFLNNCKYKNAYTLKPIKLNLTVFKHTQLTIF